MVKYIPPYIYIHNTVIYGIFIGKPLEFFFALTKPWHLVSSSLFEAVQLSLFNAFHAEIMKIPFYQIFLQ